MKLPLSTFAATDWSTITPTRHPGTTGFALWRTVEVGDMRIRKVDYSPGYLADHWCDRGHVLLVLEGTLETELADGRRFTLTAGMTYHVSDSGDAAHQSGTAGGAVAFIVD